MPSLRPYGPDFPGVGRWPDRAIPCRLGRDDLDMARVRAMQSSMNCVSSTTGVCRRENRHDLRLPTVAGHAAARTGGPV